MVEYLHYGKEQMLQIQGSLLKNWLVNIYQRTTNYDPNLNLNLVVFFLKLWIKKWWQWQQINTSLS